MVSTNRWTARLAAVLLLVCGCGTAAAQDAIFGAAGNAGSFENEFLVAANDNEAARFLNQATFGARPQDIAALRTLPFESWLDQQFAAPTTLARPFLESLAVTENSAGRQLDQSYRVHRWFDTAVTAPDQLRQKLAYALSQIVVVSDQDAGLSDETIMMAEWNDILVRNAFGNYHTLLSETTRSPMMGRYLTSLRNRKYELAPTFTPNNLTGPWTITNYAAQRNGNQPDENYAREVMQLFSIGLVMRNYDFSPIPAGGGGDLATYNQQMITTLSRVFTGLSYACSGNRVVAGRTIARNCGGCTGPSCFYSSANFNSTPPRLTINNQDDLAHPDLYEPMFCYPQFHDSGRDNAGFQLPGAAPGTPPVATTLNLGANVIPSGTPAAGKDLVIGGGTIATLQEVNPGLSRGQSVNCHTATGDAQRQQCIDYCNASLNTAVTALFNEPNTGTMIARQLIQRFVTSNPTPQYIERVARVFDEGSPRGDLKATIKAVLLDPEARRPLAQQPTDFGKPREPMLKLVQIWRTFGAVSGDTRADGFRRWGPTSPQNAYFQRPLGAPSVFNFYEPDYQQPGPIANANLFSPEFQIINENTSMLTANDLYARVCSGYGNNNCSGGFVSPAPSDRAYIPPSSLDALSNCGAVCTGPQDAQLIAILDQWLMGGTMSGQIGNPALASDPSNNGMRGELFRLLRTGMPGAAGDSNALNGRRREILYLIHLIAASPEFATQR
jgi:uncharacterized protein (DUF1800 family)